MIREAGASRGGRRRQAQKAASADPGVVAPTRDDSLLRQLALGIGGPAGRHLRGLRTADDSPAVRFWTLPRILTAMTVVAILFSVLSMQYCRINGWGAPGVYLGGCYSDVTALYSSRGFAQDPWAPFSGAAEFEYPVLTGLIAAILAQLTHWIDGVAGIGLIPEALVYWEGRPQLLYWDLTFLATAALWVALVLIVMRSAGRRPWDAAIVALSPALIFGAGINWDLWAVVALALAMFFLSRHRPILAGVMIGMGISFKLYPLFLLGALLVLALRRGPGNARGGGNAMREFLLTAASSAGAWLLINGPLMVLDWDAWSLFFTFSADRGAGYSSFWHIWNLVAEARGDSGLDAGSISLMSFLLFAAACLGVLILGLTAPSAPRLAQLMLLITAAFLLVGKVYSPQFMVWLIPLMALAIPRWRDVLIWQAFQILHFWAVWMYLAGVVGDQSPQHSFDDALYVLAVLGHMGSTIYVMVQVVLDICRPERDPVRAGPGAAIPAHRLRRSLTDSPPPTHAAAAQPPAPEPARDPSGGPAGTDRPSPPPGPGRSPERP